jgi:hypothetical protein
MLRPRLPACGFNPLARARYLGARRRRREDPPQAPVGFQQPQSWPADVGRHQQGPQAGPGTAYSGFRPQQRLVTPNGSRRVRPSRLAPASLRARRLTAHRHQSGCTSDRKKVAEWQRSDAIRACRSARYRTRNFGVVELAIGCPGTRNTGTIRSGLILRLASILMWQHCTSFRNRSS